VAVLVLAAVLASTASGARVKTFATSAPLTIDLPRTWKTVGADPGWRFKAVAPDHSAWTFLSARPDTVDFNSYAASFVAFEKEATSNLGTHVVFRTHAATVDGEKAVQVYAAGRGTTTEYFYAFVHNGVDYVLVFATTAPHAKASKPIFDAALRSVRFKNP
jgi:hypothetical protein